MKRRERKQEKGSGRRERGGRELMSWIEKEEKRREKNVSQRIGNVR